MKFMFFEVFLYIKKRTSSTVYMEISSTFNNNFENITTKQCAFFVRMADLDTTFTTHTVSRNMPKTGKKSNFQQISLSTRRKSYGFNFFKNFLVQQYKRFWGSLCFSLIHSKGTSSPTPYNIKGLHQRSNIVHKKKRGNTSITRWWIKKAFFEKLA